MIKYPYDIYCDQHGCIHEAVTNPYDGHPHEKDKDEKPVWLEHVDLDADGEPVLYMCSGAKPIVQTVVRPMAPDCTSDNWRYLWIGARYKNNP